VAVDNFNGDSDYSIMFGPDKCAGTNKVHFIYKHKNPNTGKWEEKHATNPPSIKVRRRKETAEMRRGCTMYVPGGSLW
jgi:calnexin